VRAFFLSQTDFLTTDEHGWEGDFDTNWRELPRIDFAKFAPIRVKPFSKFAPPFGCYEILSVCIRVHPWLKAIPTGSFRLRLNSQSARSGVRALPLANAVTE
jgi:hypothetical protein